MRRLLCVSGFLSLGDQGRVEVPRSFTALEKCNKSIPVKLVGHIFSFSNPGDLVNPFSIIHAWADFVAYP